VYPAGRVQALFGAENGIDGEGYGDGDGDGEGAQAEVPHARLSVRLGHTAPPCHEASTLVLDRC